MKRTLVALAALAFAGTAIAQGASFADIDADQSGDLTYAEVTAVAPEITMEAFSAADADRNGSLSEAEFAGLAGSGG